VFVFCRAQQKQFNKVTGTLRHVTRKAPLFFKKGGARCA
jgi:hypothetical protein